MEGQDPSDIESMNSDTDSDRDRESDGLGNHESGDDEIEKAKAPQKVHPELSDMISLLEILVLSLSMTRPSSSESKFWSTGKCEQIVVLVQSTKLVYMRPSLVYILRASW